MLKWNMATKLMCHFVYKQITSLIMKTTNLSNLIKLYDLNKNYEFTPYSLTYFEFYNNFEVNGFLS